MGTIDRRRFLGAAGATAGAVALGACVPRPGPDYPPQSGVPFEGRVPFPSGVGSADPTEAAVLLWTRLHPDLDAGGGVEVALEVATTPQFGPATVGTWTALATGAQDHCVTLDATGLDPSTTYWYRFTHGPHTSRVGRTRTAPDPYARDARVWVAAFSCQRWTHGWYTAHADLAALAADPATDVDVVLNLGDYVYETGFADQVYVPGREDPIQRAVTVEQFRSKYRMYRSDPNLQDVHALYPVVSVFDNHDGLFQPGDPQAPGALQAFFEHLPVRTPSPGRIDRSLRWGRNLDLLMTDQRSFRDPEPPSGGLLGTSTTDQPSILDPARSMLGPAQRDWLIDSLVGSDADWRVVGSQLMFWPWRSFGRLPGQPRGSAVYLNMTQWDGYAGERLVLLDALEAADVRDTVMFSGDSHVFSAAQVAPDVDDRSSLPRVLEFGTSSVTSNNADESDYPPTQVTRPLLEAVNPNHLRYFQSERHGYCVAEFTEEEARVQLRSPSTIRRPVARAVDVLAEFAVERGSQRMRRVLG